MPRRSALRDQLHENIRKLPADVDAVLAADVALEILVDSAWRFSRDCKRLPLAVIRELLGRRPKHASHVYLTLAVDGGARDAALTKSWARAIQGLADLETVNRWQSTQKKTKFRALAKNKHLLPAIQGAAATGENVSQNMLAVLVADGSAVSMDALIPHLDAEGSDQRIDALRRLRVHARDTPTLRAVFADLDRDAATLGARGSGIAALIGLPATPGFWFDARISMDLPGNDVSPVQLAVAVDTRKASWFRVDVAMIDGGMISGGTHFTHDRTIRDTLGIGRCDAGELPAWLARVAEQLDITWGSPLLSSSVRGAKRDQIARWLVPPRA